MFSSPTNTRAFVEQWKVLSLLRLQLLQQAFCLYKQLLQLFFASLNFVCLSLGRNSSKKCLHR